MFTGIVQAIGKVREPEVLGDGVRLTIEAPDFGMDTVRVGDSIAVSFSGGSVCRDVIENDRP